METNSDAKKMAWPCIRCDGRGWLKPRRGDAFAEECTLCGGTGIIRPTQLASLLAIGTRTKVTAPTMRIYVWRVENGTASPAIAMHVFRAISKRFPEVLRG